jgi:hypothetical protein
MAVLRKQKPWLLILGVATTAILLVDMIVLNSQAARKVAVHCLRSIPLPSDWRGAKRVIQSQNSIVVQIIKSHEISPIRMLGLRQFHDEVGRLSVINSRPSESTIGSSNGRLQAFFAIMFYGLLTAKDRPKAVFLSPSGL